jgi:hypothetical protein
MPNLPKKGRFNLAVTGSLNLALGRMDYKKNSRGFFRLKLGYRIAPETHLYHHSVGGFLVETVAGTNPTQRKELRSKNSLHPKLL